MDFIVKVCNKIKSLLMLIGGFWIVMSMNKVIENGELDLVGLGWLFCVFLDVVKELINGICIECGVFDLLMGVDKIDMFGMF